MTADVTAEDGYYAVIPEWILDADISAQAVRLYAVLRRYADQRTLHAHPSRKTLAARLRVADPKVVDRAAADLQRIGALEVYPRVTEAGDRDSNGYVLKRQPSTPSEEVSPQGGGPNATTGGGPNATTGGGRKGRAGTTAIGTTAIGTTTPPPPGGVVEPPHATFDDFWAAYPRRTDKAAARRAWTKAVKRADPDKIVDVVSRYPFPTETRFIKHPATWLNNDCWDDDLHAATAAAQPARTANGRATHVMPARDDYQFTGSF